MVVHVSLVTHTLILRSHGFVHVTFMIRMVVYVKCKTVQYTDSLALCRSKWRVLTMLKTTHLKDCNNIEEQ